MIRVFPPNATDFETGGVAINPQTCTVSEEANGMYDLDMTMLADDDYARHELIKPCAILAAPVPAHKAPMQHVIKTKGTVKIYQTRGRMDSHRVVVGFRYDRILDTGQIDNGEDPYVPIYGIEVTYSSVPMYLDDALKNFAFSLPHDDYLTLITELTDCIFCMDNLFGHVGYVKKSECEYRKEQQGDVVQVVSDDVGIGSVQPFRVTRVTRTAPSTISAHAEHVYFDALAAPLAKITASNMELSTLLNTISGRVKYNAGMTGYVTKAFAAGENAVAVAAEAAKQLNAQIVRDGYNAYFLPFDTTENTAALETGKNIVSLVVTEDVSELVTRYIPVINDADGTAVDSAHIGDYPIVYAKRVAATSQSAAQTDAENNYNNGVDLPIITLDVTCLTGTLDKLSIFDAVRVTDKRLKIDITSRVNRLDFDCASGHVTGVSIGDADKRVNVNIFGTVHGKWQKNAEG